VTSGSKGSHRTDTEKARAVLLCTQHGMRAALGRRPRAAGARTRQRCSPRTSLDARGERDGEHDWLIAREGTARVPARRSLRGHPSRVKGGKERAALDP